MTDKLADNASRRGELESRYGGKHESPQEQRKNCMIERILDLANLAEAWKRVRSNKGSAGIDGMSVEEFPDFCRKHWERIRGDLMAGNYRPAPVRRVLIPKPDGTKHPLGMPTVLDRVIQQAVSQITSPPFEADFSESSHGFRPNRSAHQAVGKMESGLSERVRRRVRLYYWKQWKQPRTRRRHLIAPGVFPERVRMASRSRKGYWRMSNNSLVRLALNNRWLEEQGVPNMRALWIALHYPEPRSVQEV